MPSLNHHKIITLLILFIGCLFATQASAFWTRQYVAVTNNSNKVIRVEEGGVISKSKVLQPGENVRYWLWASTLFTTLVNIPFIPGTVTDFHVSVQTDPKNYIFTPIYGCKRSIAFGRHIVDVRNLHDKEDGRLYCRIIR